MSSTYLSSPCQSIVNKKEGFIVALTTSLKGYN
nr:MAG TPA: hypothetical protein [Caudoviricetes sp.]